MCPGSQARPGHSQMVGAPAGTDSEEFARSVSVRRNAFPFRPHCQKRLAHPRADLAGAGVMVGLAVEEIVPSADPARSGLHSMALRGATSGPPSGVTCPSIGALALTPRVWISV